MRNIFNNQFCIYIVAQGGIIATVNPKIIRHENLFNFLRFGHSRKLGRL